MVDTSTPANHFPLNHQPGWLALLERLSTSFCVLLLLVLASATAASAQLVSVEDVKYTPVNTPVQYRWYSSNSGYQYWYISGGQGTIDANSSNTNSYQATVTWTATGPAQITYVTSSGSYSLSLNVVACRPIPGANASNYLDAGSFDACPQTKNFSANTATDCYLNDYDYNYSNSTGTPGGQPSPDVYYKFHLSRPSQVTISTCGSGFDTYLHLVSINPSTGAIQVWGDDDDSGNHSAIGCGSNTSYLSSVDRFDNASSPNKLTAKLPATLAPGDYYIIAEGWSTSTGTLQLALTVTPQVTPSVTITSNPAALAVTNNAVEIVRGNSATLTAVGDGVTDFAWQNAGTGVAVGNGSSISVSPTETTIYQVIATGCNKSLTATAQVTVQVALANLNYITTNTVLVPGKLTVKDVVTLARFAADTTALRQQQTTYFDGLGRPMQQVQVQGNTTQLDVVTPITYDPLGRRATAYLPYVGSTNNAAGKDGSYQADALTQQASFYQPTRTLSRTAQDASPMAVTKYEASPLNRVLEQGAPGAAWQPGTGHAVKFNQRANTADDAVRQWDYNPASNTFSSAGTYAAGQLLVKETRDEQNQLVTEYVDKQGKTVLKRVAASTTCNLVSEGSGPLQLHAPSGTLITIKRAIFGKLISGTCTNAVFDPQYSADVTSYVQQLVSLPQRDVAIPINYAQLGPDPYPGYIKFLLVEATYAPVGTGADLLTYYAYDDLENLRLVISPEGVNTLVANTSWALPPDFLRSWCFRYDYDGRHRVISKQTPGTDPILLAYNQRNQVVLTQDGNQQKTGEWSFTKYDGLGRPIMTGAMALAGDRATQQATLDTESVFAESVDNSNLGYTLNQAFPQTATESKLLSITYYDRYTAKYYDSSTATYIPLNSGQLACTVATDKWLATPRSLPTGTSVRIMAPDGTAGNWLTTVTYYDKYYQAVQTNAQNQLGGTTTQLMSYDFAGKLLSSTTSVTQTNPNALATTLAYKDTKRLTYYSNSLPKETFQQVYNAASTTWQPEILLVKNGYNRLGQLIAKYLHNTDGLGTKYLQKVDYRYNIRGWLTHINNRDLNNDNIEQSPGVYVQDKSELGIADPDLFGLELVYNNAEFAGTVAQYNGNIAQAMWQTRTANADKKQNNVLRTYTYSYDAANRITGAQYATNSPSGWSTAYPVDFSVSNISYDGNGNLLSMTRQGTVSGGDANPVKGTLDQLTYSYKKMVGGQLVGSNQLLGVDDAAPTNQASHDFKDNGSSYNPSNPSSAPEYAYDLNGNLLSDANKGITAISYTRLNQPSVINFKAMPATGSVPATIKYTYSATGVKLTKQVFSNGSPTPTKTTNYVGPVVFETTPSTSAPSFAQTPEGRVLYTPTSNGTSLPWKYEYHLKDHLGNLRYAFRADQDNGAVTQLHAGMESVNAAKEEQQFQHVAETRSVDPDRARTGNYVARLNAHTGRRDGPSIRVKVAAGDSIRAEVYGRYDRGTVAGSFFQKGALVAGNLTAGVPGQSGTDQQHAAAPQRHWLPFLGVSIGIIPQLLKIKRAELPVAYLRYEVFNKDSQLVLTKQQPIQRTVTDEWQQLKAGTKIDSAGFVQISLVNESGVPAYFDDFLVNTVASSPYQENHYDPFGLNLVGIEQADVPNSAFQYNGKEKQEDFGLNWNDYGSRMYDAQLGRWHSIDPLSDLMRRHSPYSYAFDNPLKFTDPDGQSPQSISSTFVGPDGNVIKHIDDKDNFVYYVTNPSAWNGQKDGLGILGMEDPSKSYKPGDKYTQYVSSTRDNSQSTSAAYPLAATITTGLALDDASGFGVVDDVLIPLVWGGALIWSITHPTPQSTVVFIDGNTSPEAATHAYEAITQGVVNIGILDRPGAKARGEQNMKDFGQPAKPRSLSIDRDEFLPKVLRPFGRTSVKYIDAPDNRRAGQSIMRQLQPFADGTRVIVIPINLPAAQ